MGFSSKAKSQRGSVLTDTLIGEGTLLEGNCISEADIRIEGEVIGDLRTSGEVVIGEKGSVRSEIQAKDVTIAGRMEGTVRVTGIVRITASGRLIGTVEAASLIIEKGAIFQGMSRMADGTEDRILSIAVV
jgi:cytoskeletal protein CcmA (bactofilin family)